MIDEGYSPAYARDGIITRTKAWQEALEDELPDSLLLEKHKALLQKKETIARNNVSTKKIEVVKTGEIDPQAVKAGLDMAYKLKKRYDNTLHIKGNLSTLSDSEVEEQASREMEEALRLIEGEGEADPGE